MASSTLVTLEGRTLTETGGGIDRSIFTSPASRAVIAEEREKEEELRRGLEGVREEGGEAK
jgi:hypothetical protein